MNPRTMMSILSNKSRGREKGAATPERNWSDLEPNLKSINQFALDESPPVLLQNHLDMVDMKPLRHKDLHLMAKKTM